MNAFRVATHLLAIGVLTAPAALGLTLTQAQAAMAAPNGVTAQPEITAPSKENQVYNSGDTVTVSARVPMASRSTTLTVTPPLGEKQLKTGPTSLTSQTLSIAIPTGGGSTIRNGTWLVQLSGGATDSRHFITDFAPATPAGFSARGSGSRQVSFAWTLGSEPDLVGYTLLAGDGTVLQDRIDPARACVRSTCSAALAYPFDYPGSHAYALVACRTSGTSRTSGPCGTTGTHDSRRATASATLAATQRPLPGAPAGGGPAAGSADSRQAGGSPQAGKPVPVPKNQRPVFASGFAAVAPSLGLPRLPAAPAPRLAGETPLPLGTYSPKLPYRPGTKAGKVGAAADASPVVTAFTSVVDPRHLLPGLAAALVLLLGAAHIRRFVRTP